MSNRDDRSIESLIRLAGGREAPSDEGTERARAAAERAWRRGIDAPARNASTPWRGRLMLACAAAGALVVASFLLDRSSPRMPVLVARVATLEGTVKIRGAGTPRPVKPAADLVSGETLATAQGRVAISFAGGLSLRIDERTRVRFDARERITLLAGTVYVDSGGLNAGPPLTIATPAGEVSHVGTQFLVSVSDGTTLVRVREGRVRLAPAGGGAQTAVAAGDELEIRAGRQVLRQGAPVFGPSWDWQASVTPMIAVEDRPLAEFLAWLARERGWQLRYADAALQQRTHEIRLHGSLEGLDTPAMLERVALVTGLDLDVRDGVLWVGNRK